MLIRSQSKELLINLDNIQLLSICGYRVDEKGVYEDKENATTWYISCTAQDCSPFVGCYTTKTKAIKVLDMIQVALDRIKYFKVMRERDIYASSTFQIPQDSEVEK